MKIWSALLLVTLLGCSSTSSEPPGPVVCSIPGGGTCAVGQKGCKWDCNSCSCRADGLLECTTMYCGDTGAPDTTGTDSSADTATDVPTDVPADSPTDVASCGDKTCGTGEVCVVPCCAPPCKPSPPHCVVVPTKCGGTPDCSCMSEACAGSGCGGMISGRLQCVCF